MGRAIAVAFVAAGASVVAVDIDAVAGQQTAALATQALGSGTTANVTFVRCDVSDSASVKAAVAAAIQQHGRVHCAINAAAIENEMRPLHECEDDDFDRIMAVNVRGIF